MSVFCWLVGLWPGFGKNYWTDFHETWMEDRSRPRIDHSLLLLIKTKGRIHDFGLLDVDGGMRFTECHSSFLLLFLLVRIENICDFECLASCKKNLIRNELFFPLWFEHWKLVRRSTYVRVLNGLKTLSINRYTGIPQYALMELYRYVQPTLTNLSVATTHFGVKLLCVLSKGEGLKNI